MWRRDSRAVSANKPFLATESQNSYVSWFVNNAATNWPCAKSATTAGALEGTLDQKRRFADEKQLLDTWEDEAPGTLLYQPLETYGVRKAVKWQPYTFYYMDLRPDNLAFE